MYVVAFGYLLMLLKEYRRTLKYRYCKKNQLGVQNVDLTLQFYANDCEYYSIYVKNLFGPVPVMSSFAHMFISLSLSLLPAHFLSNSFLSTFYSFCLLVF